MVDSYNVLAMFLNASFRDAVIYCIDIQVHRNTQDENDTFVLAIAAVTK